MSLTYTPSLTHPRTPAVKSRKVTKVLSGTTAEQVTNERILFSRAIARGSKGNNTTNTGVVHIGPDSTNPTLSIAANGSVVIEAPPGAKYDLSMFYLIGASGDGVVITLDDGVQV